MTNIEYFGFFAAFLTTFSFLPQVFQVFKTRNTDSLSLAMYSIFTLGVASWMVYGFIINNMVVIIANMLTLVFAACILSFKIYNEFFKSDCIEKAPCH